MKKETTRRINGIMSLHKKNAWQADLMKNKPLNERVAKFLEGLAANEDIGLKKAMVTAMVLPAYLLK